MKEIENKIMSVFSYMSDAENVIQEMKDKYPAHSDLIHKTFILLYPSSLLMDIDNKKLYQAHCKEIIERVVKGQDTTKGTNAELVAFCSNLSLQAPLNNDFAYVYETLFEGIFGKLDAEGYKPSESYPNRSKEIINDLRNKLSNKERRLTSGQVETEQKRQSRTGRQRQQQGSLYLG